MKAILRVTRDQHWLAILPGEVADADGNVVAISETEGVTKGNYFALHAKTRPIKDPVLCERIKGELEKCGMVVSIGAYASVPDLAAPLHSAAHVVPASLYDVLAKRLGPIQQQLLNPQAIM